MVIYGYAHRVGDHITTYDIVGVGQYDGDPALLAAYCLTAVDPTLAASVRQGDILLTGHGFGSGDQAGTAVLALQALGIVALICDSVDPTFYEAALVYGLPILIAPNIVQHIQVGELVRLDLGLGRISTRNAKAEFQTDPVPAQALAHIHRSYLHAQMRRHAADEDLV